ncbi:hypothetical protein [Pseudomonas frederiksbergensis]|uniref:hypothetical protein n=1 Tax=Pseudomonas frederiksbergensis TaxID=104087 RepID=UPI003D2119D4
MDMEDLDAGAMKSRTLVDSNKGYHQVPFIGELPTFNYLDAIKYPSLAMDDSVVDYVYILRRTDKTDGDTCAPQPFYVGMGSARRYAFHYYEAVTTAAYAAKRNRLKINVMNKVGRDEVLVQIVACPSFEYSKELEIKLIAHWGRKDKKTGCLTNLTEGGEGVRGLIMPEHVLEMLREKALQPVKFNGKVYAGIKVAFEEHSAIEIAQALQVDVVSGYCTSYATFKAWYHNWASQGIFPAGFNYINNDEPVFPEVSREEIQEQIRANRLEGYQKAWNTRYPYPRFMVKGKPYYTLAEAVEQEEVGTQSNLAALFRRMASRNLFYVGYNILDEQGNKLFEETAHGLLDVARLKASEFLIALTSKPLIVDGFLYDNRLQAFEQTAYSQRMGYGSFTSQINRYEEAGVFPIGLNVPDEGGAPIYPEIDPFLLSGSKLSRYYKVCNRLFPSMQSASFFYGLSRTGVHNYFTAWTKDAERLHEPKPFPKGFNVYDTKTQKAIYPEMEVVDSRVPASGYLYEGRFFKKLIDIDKHRGIEHKGTSALYIKRRNAYFKHRRPFDSLLNVLGWDGTPLYPVDLNLTLSKLIARADGTGYRLHNAANPVWILVENEWKAFDSKANAYRALPFLQKKYKNVDSFTSSVASQFKAGRQPEWIAFSEPLAGASRTQE